jgi:hypothetical protein
VVVGVTLVLPAGFCGPLHAPLAVHAVTPLDDQLSTALCPSVMVAGVTLMVMPGVGAGGGAGTIGNDPVVPNEQLKKEEACAQIAMTPAHPASAFERELRLFDTCMARVPLSQLDRSGTLSARPLHQASRAPESLRLCSPFTLAAACWQGKERPLPAREPRAPRGHYQRKRTKTSGPSK